MLIHFTIHKHALDSMLDIHEVQDHAEALERSLVMRRFPLLRLSFVWPS